MYIEMGFFRMRIITVLLVSFVIVLNLSGTKCTERKSKQFELQTKETNTPNFVRLFLMRLIWGLAKSMGLAERLSGFLGGVFVPPGAEDYDDYGDDYGDDGFAGGDLF